MTRRRLLDAGFTPDEIKRRVRSGTLIVVHRGVYRVGHQAPSREASYLAAVEACGPGSLLFCRAAGHLEGLLRGPAPPPEVLTRGERRIEGIRTVRSRELAPVDAAVVFGIPVTTVARTLVDLAAVLGDGALARACHEAWVVHRTTPGEVEAVLARRPNSPGAGVLRRVLRGDVKLTLSGLERRFLALLRAERLPLPETNGRIDGRLIDCRWPSYALTVELDSYRYHGTRHAWEKDRRREREAHARGDEFRRYTRDDVFVDPRYLLAELRNLLRCPA